MTGRRGRCFGLQVTFRCLAKTTVRRWLRSLSGRETRPGCRRCKSSDLCSGDCRKLTPSSILPALKRNLAQKPFVLSLLATWVSKGEPAFSEEIFVSTFDQLWTLSLTLFDVAPPPPPRTKNAKGRQGAAPKPSPVSDTTARNLARMMEFLYREENLEPQLLDLQTLVYRRAILASKGDVLVDLWLPFLRYLPPVAVEAMRGECGGWMGGLWPLIYQISISRINIEYIGLQPAPFRGWGRAGMKCDCDDVCSDVNDFLRDHKKQVGRFRVDERQRIHLIAIISRSRFDGTYETTTSSGDTQASTKTVTVIKRDHAKDKHDDWVACCRRVFDEIQKFEQQGLRQLLGDDMTYEEIVGLYAAGGGAIDVPELEFLRQPRLPLREVRIRLFRRLRQVRSVGLEITDRAIMVAKQHGPRDDEASLLLVAKALTRGIDKDRVQKVYIPGAAQQASEGVPSFWRR